IANRAAYAAPYSLFATRHSLPSLSRHRRRPGARARRRRLLRLRRPTLSRGQQSADQPGRIEQRARSAAAAEIDRGLRHELVGVGQRGRQHLGMRVGELRQRLQRELELAQLPRRLRPEHLDLRLLAGRDRGQLVALALAFIARRERVLHRGLHADLGTHQRALLVGGLLRLLRIDALLLGSALLDERLGELRGELLAPHRDEQLRRYRRLAEPHLADGDAGFRCLGTDAPLDLALDQRALIDEVEHLGGPVDGDEVRLAVAVEDRLAVLVDPRLGDLVGAAGDVARDRADRPRGPAVLAVPEGADAGG